MEFKDKAGRVVKRGDFIVYSTTAGRAAVMQYGRVLKVYQAPTPKYYSDDYKPIKIKFIGVTEDCTGWDDVKGRSIDELRLQKESSLEFGERVLVVSKGQCPPEVVALLKTVQVSQ